MIAFRRPSPWAVALLLVGVIVFISAGSWQYDKAQYKRARESSWSDAQARAPVDIGSALAGDANGFTRVVADGTWLPQRYLLDNQVRNGRPGVEVFAPLRLSSGPVVLVALGWLACTDAQRSPPAIQQLAAGTVSVNGLLAPPPAHGLRIGRSWPEQSDYPKLMPYFSLSDIAADLDDRLAARVLRADGEPGLVYRRDWQPVDSMPPARHLAYAWQWWFLAIAIVVVFAVVHRKRDSLS
jgi:surfeit locus 1 family protein